MDLTILKMFVDKDKVGGWVRGFVAAGLPSLVASYGLSWLFSPTVCTAIGIALSGMAVGAWSHYVKS